MNQGGKVFLALLGVIVSLSLVFTFAIGGVVVKGDVEPTSIPTATFSPTNTPQPTVTPYATFVPVPCVATTLDYVNARRMPTLDSEIFATLNPDLTLIITATTPEKDWYMYEDFGPLWVSADYIELTGNCGELDYMLGAPIVEEVLPTSVFVEATAMPLPTTVVPTQVAEPTQIPVQPVCDCSYNAYNCTGSSIVPVGCFDYCNETGAGDVHGLDRDNDGLACESN